MLPTRNGAGQPFALSMAEANTYFTSNEGNGCLSRQAQDLSGNNVQWNLRTHDTSESAAEGGWPLRVINAEGFNNWRNSANGIRGFRPALWVRR